jgi:hypothetical protein
MARYFPPRRPARIPPPTQAIQLSPPVAAANLLAGPPSARSSLLLPPPPADVWLCFLRRPALTDSHRGILLTTSKSGVNTLALTILAPVPLPLSRRDDLE